MQPPLGGGGGLGVRGWEGARPPGAANHPQSPPLCPRGPPPLGPGHRCPPYPPLLRPHPTPVGPASPPPPRTTPAAGGWSRSTGGSAGDRESQGTTEALVCGQNKPLHDVHLNKDQTILQCPKSNAVHLRVWPLPDLPLACARSDMIRWGRVLLSHTLDAARSY